MKDYLRANFTIRRTLALLTFWVCIFVCLGVVLGVVQLGLWPTLGVLLFGLLAYEFAG